MASAMEINEPVTVSTLGIRGETLTCDDADSAALRHRC